MRIAHRFEIFVADDEPVPFKPDELFRVVIRVGGFKPGFEDGGDSLPTSDIAMVG